jgi:hypothetical protein
MSKFLSCFEMKLSINSLLRYSLSSGSFHFNYTPCVDQTNHPAVLKSSPWQVPTATRYHDSESSLERFLETVFHNPIYGVLHIPDLLRLSVLR